MRSRRHARSLSRIAALQSWAPRSISIALLIVSLALFFITAYNPSSLQGTRNHVTDIVAPLLATISYPIERTADYVRAITGLANIQAENQQLRMENSRLREWHQTALQLQTKNQALEGLLHVKPSPEHHFITARIIADSGNSYIKSLLILAGTNDGVTKGQAVLSASGLIGRVIEAGETASRVLLLTDTNSRIPVMIQKKKWHAILAGQNDQDPTLIHLPPTAQLSDDMTVITSGHGGLFPAGLPVGKIKIQENGEHYIEPFANAHQFTYVKIIDKVLDKNLLQGKL